MKKILLATFVIFSMASFAQGHIGKGEKQINFGIGFIDGIPMHIGADFGVHPDVSVGPEVDFDLGGFDWMRIKARGDYHWATLMGISGPWDVYSGVSMGGKIRFDNNGKGGGSGFLFQVNMGGRWYWSDWGVSSEFNLGTDINFRFGVSKKL